MAAWMRAPAASGLLGTLALILVLFPLRWSGALQPLELAAYDRLVGLRGDGPGEQPRVVQITVTEADIERSGWPLSDGSLADAITRIHAAKPRAIGIDIFRPIPIGPGSDRLVTAINDASELVWADRFSEGTWAGISAPQAAAARAGFSDVLLDPGGIARRALLYLDDGKRIEPAISLRLALAYLRAEGVRPRPDAQGFLRLGNVSLKPLDADLGGYRGIDTRGYQVLREFRAPQRLKSFSFGDLMDGKVPAEAMAGRIVVMGIVADSVKDYVVAPISVAGPRTIPGVTLHGLFAAELVSHGLDGLPATHALSRTGEFALLLLIIVAGGVAGTFIPRLAWIVVLLFGEGRRSSPLPTWHSCTRCGCRQF